MYFVTSKTISNHWKLSFHEYGVAQCQKCLSRLLSRVRHTKSKRNNKIWAYYQCKTAVFSYNNMYYMLAFHFDVWKMAGTVLGCNSGQKRPFLWRFQAPSARNFNSSFAVFLRLLELVKCRGKLLILHWKWSLGCNQRKQIWENIPSTTICLPGLKDFLVFVQRKRRHMADLGHFRS